LAACDNVPLSVEVEAADYIVAAEAPENAEIDVNSEETKLDEIEYKTIEPPEDGWTLELLNEVTYINGKDIDLPFCLNDLGDEFYYEEIIYHDVGYASALLCVNDIYLATVCCNLNDNGEIDQYTPISKVSLTRNIEDDSLNNFITINGVNFNTPKNEANKRLGLPYETEEDFDFIYSIDNKGNAMSWCYPITGNDRENDKAYYLIISMWEE
jgi:hypothetical protein